jgi:glycerol-3-phosphate acyltransferase PlsX
MPQGVILSIDAMGGDHAPVSVLDGLEVFCRRHPQVRALLHGDADRLGPLLAQRPAAQASTSVRHAESVIGMEVKPSQALRQGKGSSLWGSLQAVEEGEAAAAVSAGNTGALMALARLRLRTLPGVDRPALVANWPTPRGFTSVLDAGANLDSEASQLLLYAIMGEAFHRARHGVARPSIGLLNIGAEELKGHEEIREAARLLRDSAPDLDFRGFVEGDDISLGAVDVVVTDGFTGNVALKTAEGAAKLLGRTLKEELTRDAVSKLGALAAAPALNRFRSRMDPRKSNGAVLLGVKGLVVKSHGGADGEGFAAALDVAYRLAEAGFLPEVEATLSRFALMGARVEPEKS